MLPKDCVTSCDGGRGEGECCGEWLTDDARECPRLSERLLAVVSNPDDVRVKEAQKTTRVNNASFMSYRDPTSYDKLSKL